MRYQARTKIDGKSKLVDLESTLLDDARDECDALTQVPFVAPEFIVKTEQPAAERAAVLKVMRSSEWDRMDDDEAAEAIIAKLNEVRENAKRFVVVANLQWPDCKDFHLFASGPFNTERQAEAVGMRFAADPATNRGKGRWRVVPILAPVTGAARLAWDQLRPPPQTPCCSLHHGRMRDEMGTWQWITAGPDTEHWTEKVGW